jgi:Tryptophan synthase beta chain
MEYMYYLKEYVGRELPCYIAEKLSKKYGAESYLIREDVHPTGCHKIYTVVGPSL